MTQEKIHILAVGKTKDVALIQLADLFLARLTTYKTQIHEIKSAPNDLAKEGKLILEKISTLQEKTSKLTLFLLDERGQECNSIQFQQCISKGFEEKGGLLVFILGGAFGHSAEVQSLNCKKISLSQMTLPHQLARLFLLEQIYRAQCIQAKHPYHQI